MRGLPEEPPLLNSLLTTAGSVASSKATAICQNSIYRVSFLLRAADKGSAGHAALLAGAIGYTARPGEAIKDTLEFAPFSAWALFVEADLAGRIENSEDLV